mmetsp:Transcript_13482/g.37324  ORF Transcript_13482/g.37324 Transcript_13482/m.37324 type:complete len:386 (-) Transcript_13482:92-1249(-)
MAIDQVRGDREARPTTYDEFIDLLRQEEAGDQRIDQRTLRLGSNEHGAPWAHAAGEPRAPRSTLKRAFLIALAGAAIAGFAVGLALKREEPTAAEPGRTLGNGASLVTYAVSTPTTITWLEHPDKCLDVAGQGKGAGLQIWDCDEDYPYQQEFMVPPLGVSGPIRWALNPHLCLDNPVGHALQFWSCDAPAKNIMWTVSPDGQGRIHLSSDMSKCLDIPDQVSDNGWHLQAWHCDTSKDAVIDKDMRFVVKTQDCSWGDWHDWLPCNASCGGGHRQRTRDIVAKAVNGGKDCRDLDGQKTEACYTQPCTTTTVALSTLTVASTVPSTTTSIQVSSTNRHLIDPHHLAKNGARASRWPFALSATLATAAATAALLGLYGETEGPSS